MATSGSVDFGLNARQIIDFALKKIRVLGAGETASAEQAESAMRELNLMLKGWQKYENLWRLTEGSVTLVADTWSYALSPVPYRVVSARYHDDDNRDLTLTLLTREEYYETPLKTASGIPTEYYVDYQRTAATIYFPNALTSVTSETVKYTYQRKFEDIDSLDNDIDVRQEWLEVVGFNLAARLADDFGRAGEVATRVIARAEELREMMLDDDREDEIRFVPA